jgi:hypothetical protein
MNDDETLHNLTNSKLPFVKKRKDERRGQTSYQGTTLKITNKPMQPQNKATWINQKRF